MWYTKCSVLWCQLGRSRSQRSAGGHERSCSRCEYTTTCVTTNHEPITRLAPWTTELISCLITERTCKGSAPGNDVCFAQARHKLANRLWPMLDWFEEVSVDKNVPRRERDSPEWNSSNTTQSVWGNLQKSCLRLNTVSYSCDIADIWPLEPTGHHQYIYEGLHQSTNVTTGAPHVLLWWLGLFQAVWIST